MTQPSDSFETYDAVGNREHLIDMIYALDTAETPLGRIRMTYTTTTFTAPAAPDVVI